ncbi:MAG: 16S rRNA (cytosine(967)-C(5))-methyltransferase RsmB [Acutalibacteraceae bacterium]|nr:16S rRNA (cytosine(967)-C(5))-methyltransferase RsmB [Acutalibacteraceae bacterium]
MKSARQVAFEALLKVHRDGAYSNLVVDSLLKENKDLDERDKAFVCNLVYGTLDRLILIDYNLGLYLNQPVKKLKPELHTILRMGTYQLLFMDKVPSRAAVNESVNLAKVNKSAFAASLVNAVLRRVSDNGVQLPEGGENSTEYLAVKYSCPEWIIELWADAYGIENAVALAEKALEAAPVVIRVNTTKTTPDDLINKLADEGVTAEKSDIIPNALIISNTGSVEELEAYKEGLFHAQDIASQLCCMALDAKEGETVFDLCAAPGGKTFTIAENMNNTGIVRSFDIYQSRVELIKSGAERLGLDNVYTYLSDASIFNENYGFADKVLCDVPCSGLGIIRRKPEIRFKKKSEIDGLPEIQYRILCNAVKYLKDGGRLVYSTCTLNPQENSQVCDRFLSEHPEFSAVEVHPDLPRYGEGDKYLTLMPHLHSTDGFFVAAFIKNGGAR